MKSLTLLLLAASVSLVGCHSPQAVGEYRRVGTLYETAPVERSGAEVRRIAPIDPYYTGTTYRDRTLYGRP